LAKFGKKEHLESLKKGLLYFNPIQKYRDDGTDFRGDPNEGVIPIDPSRISIKDSKGRDWFNDLGIPRPTSVMKQAQNDSNTFIFCSAIISKNVLIPHEDKINSVLCETFKNAIRKFGEYVLLFNSYEIITRLIKVQKTFEPRFGYMSGPIIYRDLADFSEIGDYHKAYRISSSFYDRYFVKDSMYKNQNEWRLLIDGESQPLVPNCGDGFSLQIGKLDWAYLYETTTFLNTFQCL